MFTPMKFRLPAHLTADCSACCGLCCVALPFDASQGFGFDKPAHTPCTLLRSDNRCSIHADLRTRGFSGCASYDCYGAGQFVTRTFGASWRASKEVAQQMFEAFRRARATHELAALLTFAITRSNDPATTQRLHDALERIEAVRDLEFAD